MTEVLYMSYDGMTDPLGQSQVIPYLQGLAKLGYRFTLISFEKKERYQKYRNHIAELLQQSNIDWVPLTYTKNPPVLSTIYDVAKLKQCAFSLHRKKNFSIVHCRSYITSLIGLAMKQQLGVKFIFDMRGFYADERVDGGLWNLRNPLYRLVYRFFKQKEKQFLQQASYTISLTQNAKEVIQSWNDLPGQPLPIQVIPCCADLQKFSPATVNVTTLTGLKQKLAIAETDFVLSYLGSVGTWYLLDEMLDFFSVLLQLQPRAKFLFITTEPAHLILNKASEKNIPANKFIIEAAPHTLVPAYLALSHASVFFIKPVFSKRASSPTKQAEIMGMGIPHICNAGVGDAALFADKRTGVVIESFDTHSYLSAAQQLLNTTYSAEHIQQKAEHFFSLIEGVKKYHQVYLAIQ